MSDKITYVKRAKGGYYAFTPSGCVIVYRHYEFTLPTRTWVAKFKGKTVFGESRKDVVQTIIDKKN